MGMKKTINYIIQLTALVLASCLTMAVIGGLAAIVTGSYKSVLSYLFR